MELRLIAFAPLDSISCPETECSLSGYIWCEEWLHWSQCCVCRDSTVVSIITWIQSHVQTSQSVSVYIKCSVMKWVSFIPETDHVITMRQKSPNFTKFVIVVKQIKVFLVGCFSIWSLTSAGAVLGRLRHLLHAFFPAPCLKDGVDLQYHLLGVHG